MRLQALNVLYHSPVCLPEVRQAIVEFMTAQGALAPGEEPGNAAMVRELLNWADGGRGR